MRILATNSAAALVTPLFVLLLSGETSTKTGLVRVFLISAVYANTIGFPAQWILPRIYPHVAAQRRSIQWIILIISLVCLSGIGCAIATLFVVGLHITPSAEFWPVLSNSFKIAAFIATVFGVVIEVYERQRSRLLTAELKIRTEELERERAVKLATEARLTSLEARVHPHFLFNSLNSISSLIPADPVRAERLIERMAALLRFSLDVHRGGLVPLGQEMQIVHSYLELEQVRLGSRLRYRVESLPDVSNVSVPPFSVQTLVENSIKFAIAPFRQGGEICVHAQANGDRLSIRVGDTGPGFRLDSVPAGHGLDNLRSRLGTLFGGGADLTVSRDDKWTIVTLKVPI
jgi:sensor histidine kinase YesM